MGDDIVTLTKEQLSELLEVSKPLMQWLKDNGHHHVWAIVDSESVEEQPKQVSKKKRTKYLISNVNLMLTNIWKIIQTK